MIQGLSNGSSLARAALDAALKSQQAAAAKVDVQVEQALGETAPAQPFGATLGDALRAVDGELAAADKLPLELVSGSIGDFHQVAAQIKNSELTFKFALEVRNKLIEAYRETMRMSV
jgi:flagellar hook-basal body complex protein FliE